MLVCWQQLVGPSKRLGFCVVQTSGSIICIMRSESFCQILGLKKSKDSKKKSKETISVCPHIDRMIWFQIK